MASLKIQIWSGSVGGHEQAARSIARALKELCADVEIEIVDTIARDFVNPHFSWALKAYDKFVFAAPFLWKVLYDGTNVSPFLLVRKRLFSQLVNVSVKEKIQVSGTQVIVRVIADYGQLEALTGLDHRPLVVTVVTDPVTFHQTWVSPHSPFYFVSTKEAEEACVRYGVARENIRVLGFPIRSDLFQPSTLSEMKCARGPFRVLMMGGTSGFGRLNEDLKILLHSNLELEITVVCGRNQKLYNELKSLPINDQNINRLHVIGFTDQIPAIMRNSDVLITKAGPTTIYEAIACQLPVIINSHIPGQEAGNPEYFRSAGVAMVSRSPRDTLKLVERLIQQPNLLSEMKNHELALRVLQSSREIAREILTLAGSR